MGKLIKVAQADNGAENRPESALIIARAEAEAEVMIGAAEKSGYEAGRAQVEPLAQHVDSRCKELRQSTDRRLQSGIRELVGSCLDALLEDDERFFKLVRNALRSQRRGREIFLRVHPSRAAHLHEHKAGLIAVLGRARSIEIREDITLGRDGCVVETDAGMLDVGLGTQLSALFEGIAP